MASESIEVYYRNESTKVHNARHVRMIVTESCVEIISLLLTYGNCHMTWSVLHIELARMPNRALSHKMADLYAKLK